MPFTFIPHAGLPPGYSHTCQTPWSVFLDGSEGPVPSAGPRAAPGRELAVKPRSRVEARRRGAADPARRSAPGENPRLSRRAEAGPIRVSSYRFQALFDSLFKVLCIFPSRYLFAIGLSPVFSLRWNLPPNWSSIPKELDSAKAPRGATVARPTGLSPSLVPHSRGLGPRPPQGQRSQDYNSEAAGAPDFQVGLFPVHSPLLGESWLVSFPPLSDMLKFGG